MRSAEDVPGFDSSDKRRPLACSSGHGDCARLPLKTVTHAAGGNGAAQARVFLGPRGVVRSDGTPLKSVEVRVDDGPWQPATMDPSTSGKYSWKLFTYIWNGATSGEHTLVSRVTDVNGKVQPTAEDLENKKSFLEDNSQHPRKVMIS